MLRLENRGNGQLWSPFVGPLPFGNRRHATFSPAWRLFALFHTRSETSDLAISGDVSIRWRLFISPDIGNTIALPLFGIASVLPRLDHVARCIEKANQSIMSTG